ncbi:WAT1-related protein, partial [Cucurbita argyrosperma subsp. argyrosperma]
MVRPEILDKSGKFPDKSDQIRMLQMMEAAMPFTAMIMVESTDVIISTLIKVAMAKGMNNLVFLVYSNALATFLLLPFLLFSSRNNLGAPLSFSMILAFFLLGLNGSVGELLANTGINYSSPVLLSAMANLIPIFTVFLAVIFRMERLDFKRSSGKAKCLGTIIAVSGAFLITLYKGPVLIMSSSQSVGQEAVALSQKPNWVFAFAVFIKTNPTVWQVRPDIEMVTIVFSAIFGSMVRTGVHIWCLQRKGPVFVAMFKPLGMVIAVALAVSFLRESLCLGRSERKEMAGSGTYLMEAALPFPAMISMECINVGLNTLFKSATASGMSHHVFVVYSYSLAALLLLPSPFISRRSRRLPPLSFSVLSKIALLGLIGSSSQIMGYTGINYSSPTLASAISNLVPAFTFILAVIFRMEKVVLRRHSSQAKVMGTIISISGAFVVTLYKGPRIMLSSAPTALSLHHPLPSSHSNWTRIMKEYPDEATVIFFYNLTVAFIAAIVGVVLETDPSAWILKHHTALASVLCSGLFGSCLNNTVHTWALRLKGPVFVAMFKPLSIVVAIVMGVLFLGDSLYLGSVVGASIISIGFYTVMWGKAKEERGVGEEKEEGHTHNISGNKESHEDQRVPLLGSYNTHRHSADNAMSQGFAIELYFDPALENQVLKAWNVLARRQISTQLIEIESRPHITLFSSPFLEPTKVESIVKNFASKQEPLPLSLSSIGSLPSDNNVLFLGPAPSISLLQFQSQLCEAMRKEGIEIGEEYRPGSWIPHCSVAQEVPRARMAEAFCVLRDLKLPVSGYAIDIGLVEFSPVRELFSFVL